MAPAGPYLGAAEGAEQRVDLVDAADEFGPAQPRASGELVVVLFLADPDAYPEREPPNGSLKVLGAGWYHEVMRFQQLS